MREPKTSRPYQERFLDGFDRSQLRQEVQKVKPKGFASLRKKYATWALGGALALGGLGVPLSKFAHTTTQASEGASARRVPSPTPQNKATTNQIAGDLQTARQIADQVAGGVQGAVSTVAETAASAPAKIAQEVALTPQAIAKVAGAAEQAREAFFAKEVPFRTRQGMKDRCRKRLGRYGKLTEVRSTKELPQKQRGIRKQNRRSPVFLAGGLAPDQMRERPKTASNMPEATTSFWLKKVTCRA